MAKFDRKECGCVYENLYGNLVLMCDKHKNELNNGEK